MSPLFQKLNAKGRARMLVLDAPESFEAELAGLEGVAVDRDAASAPAVSFAIAFVRTLAEVERAVAAIVARVEVEGDPIVWFAYPKGTSKRYTCEFNRDTGWDAVGAAGFEPVRMVAIDQDWSALRFRRVDRIRTLTRDASMALSAEGKARASKSKPAPEV